MNVSVRPILSKRDKKLFLDVPFALYGKSSNWVAPLYVERFEHLDPKKNPYFQHAETELFLAEMDGKPLGRISAQIDRLHLERYNDATGQFGFLKPQMIRRFLLPFRAQPGMAESARHEACTRTLQLFNQ